MIAPSKMPPEQFAVLEKIYESRKGSIVADSVSPPLVVLLMDSGWIAWWPGKSRITFTPLAAELLLIKLNGQGRWIDARKGERPIVQKPHEHETNATSANYDMSQCPDKERRPPGDDDYRRPHVIIGLTCTWNGPHLDVCPTCGNRPYRPKRAGQHYCCYCDGERVARTARAQTA